MGKEKINTEKMNTDEKIDYILQKIENMDAKYDLYSEATNQALKNINIKIENMDTKIEMKFEYLENKYDYTQKSINLLEKQMRYMENGNTEFRRRSTRPLVHVPNSVISDEFRLLSDDDLL